MTRLDALGRAAHYGALAARHWARWRLFSNDAAACQAVTCEALEAMYLAAAGDDGRRPPQHEPEVLAAT